MKKLLAILIIFLFSINCFSQNLVPNPSFEDYYEYEKGNYYPTNWICIHGVPDLIIYEKDSIYDILRNDSPLNSKLFKRKFDYKLDIENNCIVNYTWSLIGTKLISKLEKDQKYYIEFYVKNFPNNSFFTKSLGIFLTNNLQFENKKSDYNNQIVGELLNINSLILTPTEFITNTETWKKVSGIYKAKGDEEYLIFGYSDTIFDLKNNIINGNQSINIGESKWLQTRFLVDNICLMLFDYYIDSVYNVLKSTNKLVINDINFELNSSTINKNSYFELNNLVKILNNISDKKLLISGHTDNTGDVQQNILLSENRAKSVVDYLVSKGISQDRLKYIGYGSSKPIVSNINETGKAKNRRVEIELVE